MEHILDGILLCNQKDSIVSFERKWIGQGVIMLIKVSKEVKDNHWMVSLICGMQRIKTYKFEFKKVVNPFLRCWENYGGYHWEGDRILMVGVV